MIDALLGTLLLGGGGGLEVVGGGDKVVDCDEGCCLEDGAADSLSSVDGSVGGGPSSAHLRDSYFDRIKDSNLLGSVSRVGRWKVKRSITYCSGGT